MSCYESVKSGRSDRRRNLNTACDSSALDSIRIEIEVYSSNIKQQKYDISKCADSSKKRGHLRQKMEKEKKKLAAVIELYTSKSGEEIVIEDVTKEDYIFPWEQCSVIHGIEPKDCLVLKKCVRHFDSPVN
ncbi:uncharacterized protein LOC135489380 [Lineus longissimus]|uniref:uncharacterized protein LOC135489380 n=1 Tax=Lineus longissimus TaxID=88925 RepID=UPI00315D7176